MAQQGGVAALVATIAGRQAAIEEWLAAELAKQQLPFYCSVDLRLSDHKIAPVDTNLFPGGFNNLAADLAARAAAAAKGILTSQWPKAQRLAIVTERHTRNPYYVAHLIKLRELAEAAGAEVRLAFFDGTPQTLQSHHQSIEVGALERIGDKVAIDGFEPDLIILNHDQTAGTPAIIEGLAQPITPPPHAGWAHRRKSAHFLQYDRVVGRFAADFALDPWQLAAYFNICMRVDVSRNIGLDCLARAIDETLADIRANHKRMAISEKPFVALKADAGTYGMGVLMVDDPAAVHGLNRRQRQNLSVIKEGVAVTDILIQEGVPTTDRIEGLVAEPVLYMVGAEVVGGFWRLNQQKAERDNLNSRGMLFWPFAAEPVATERSYAMTVVARLALLATTRELAGELARTCS